MTSKLLKRFCRNLPKQRLKVLLNALVVSHFEYSCLCLTSISENLLQSLEKQLNWGLKTAFYRSSKGSIELKISESILNIKQQIDLKGLEMLFAYINNEKEAFKDNLDLPTAKYRINQRNSKIVLIETIRSCF